MRPHVLSLTKIDYLLANFVRLRTASLPRTYNACSLPRTYNACSGYPAPGSRLPAIPPSRAAIVPSAGQVNTGGELKVFLGGGAATRVEMSSGKCAARVAARRRRISRTADTQSKHRRACWWCSKTKRNSADRGVSDQSTVVSDQSTAVSDQLAFLVSDQLKSTVVKCFSFKI